MKTRASDRSVRSPLRRRLLVLGIVALSFHAPAMAKSAKAGHRHHAVHKHHAPHRHGAVAARHLGAPLEAEAVVGGFRQTGSASWYGKDFHGHRTANGEAFDRAEFTGAHRTLPFGTVVRVTNLRNGRSALVRINDRGPFSGNRIIDLSYAAAKQIGMAGRGVARVRVEEVAPARFAKDDHLKTRS